MEEFDLTASELKKEIDDNKMIGSGFFGTTFLYKGKLIKMDKILYNLLKINSPTAAKHTIDQFYKYGRPMPTSDINDPIILMYEFVDPEKIREIASKRKDITLTKLPEGVLRVDGRTLGIILPYHENYEALEKLSPTEHEVLLEILKRLRLALIELADNKISQNDLSHYDLEQNDGKLSYNILYQGKTPQIIDLDGPNVKVGKDFIDAKTMYNELAFIILDYFRKNNLTTTTKFEDINDEHQAKELIEEFEHRLRGK